MLFLLLKLGTERFALDAAAVAEVLPLVRLRPLPLAPPGVAGVFNHRGTPVPALDLSQLLLGRPAPARLSTRLVLAVLPAAAGGKKVIGLIAEGATELIRREPGAFSAPAFPTAPFLGPVATDEHGLIHRLDLARLWPGAGVPAGEPTKCF